MSTVKVKEGESLESALRRFKRQTSRDGVIQEVRKREHYEKPSVKRKLKSEAARKRIDQYTKTAGIAYQLLHTELTIYIKGGTICSFNDKQVHTVLERSGIKKKVFDTVKGANEWYCCDLETVKKAIHAVKNGESSLHPSDVSQGKTPIIFRP